MGIDNLNQQIDDRQSFKRARHRPKKTLVMARLHLLEDLDRWDSSDFLPRLRNLEKQLQDGAREMLHPQEAEVEVSPTPVRTVMEVVALIEKLLLKLNPKSFAVWRFLGRCWPYILVFAEDASLERLGYAMRMSSRGCSLHVWMQMGEVAAYQYSRCTLELLENVPLLDHHLPVVEYCQHQLFNLLLELREQVIQEVRKNGRTQMVNFRWGLGQGGFTVTLTEALKGKVDAIYLTGEDVKDVTFLCEAVDETRFAVRAIHEISSKSLSLALQKQLMECECRPIAIYATVAGGQREALKNLVAGRKATKVTFNPVLKGAIIDSWYARLVGENDVKEEIFNRCEEIHLEGSLKGV